MKLCTGYLASAYTAVMLSTTLAAGMTAGIYQQLRFFLMGQVLQYLKIIIEIIVQHHQ